MLRDLQKDLQHLSTLAFRRKTQIAPLLEKFHSLRDQIDRSGHADLIWNIYDWLLVPLSLWPLDFEGLSSYLLNHLKSFSASSSGSSVLNQPLTSKHSKLKTSTDHGPLTADFLPSDLGLPSSLDIRHSSFAPILPLLNLIDPPPSTETQSIVASFEHDIESGRYEKMLKQAQKFDEHEKALLQNEQLAAEWAALKRLFNIKDFQNSRGVIRRRMSQERNLREAGWQFDPSDPRRLFHFHFDAFCYRWKLYGMEHDRPLLLKISVNPTPHGTMIVIPRHWSLDPRRDLDWTLINRLHRARGAKKQGPKMSAGRIQKLDQTKQVKALHAKARRLKLKGESLHEFICQAMRRDIRSDPSWWKRLLKTKN